MSNSFNLIGKKFGKLIVIDHIGSFKKRNYWLCECECGEYTTTFSSMLTTGKKKSCGCLISNCAKKHGMTNTPEYNTWSAIIDRCYNKNNNAYKNYGGRGIKMCKEWRDSFEIFYADMGKKPSKKHSIDRIYNNGDYSKYNCKWATDFEQSMNKRNNRFITVDDQTKHLDEWCKIYNISKNTFYNRINKGFTEKDAITKHVRKRPEKRIEIDGSILNLSEWCRFYNIHISTVQKRIKLGWTIKKSLSTPVSK